MQLFRFRKNKKEEAPKPLTRVSDGIVPVSKKRTSSQVKESKTVATRSVAMAMSADASTVILNPRVTEKASFLSERNNVYTFNVTADANKHNIAQTVNRLYKVTPLQVRIVGIPEKRVFVRGKRGVKRGGRKAYVFLKKGDKIEIA